MANPQDAAKKPADQKKPEKRKLKKKLAAFIPFVKWHPGLIVCGVVERKFSNNSEFGVKDNLEIKLLDPVTFTDGNGEIKELLPDDLLNISESAGLKTAMTLDVGTTVQIECTGKKDLGKGRKPAWEFEVEYE